MTTHSHDSLPDLAISTVVHYSDLWLLERLLISLAGALELTGLSRTDLICVDHSQDAEYAARGLAVCDRHQGAGGLNIQWLRAPTNSGYGAGHNVALRQVSSRFHLLLNPDVEFDETALQLALDYLRSAPELAVLAPIAFNAQGNREYLAKDYPSVMVLAVRAFTPEWVKRLSHKALARYEMRAVESPTLCRPIFLASGCCMWVRRDLLDAAGGFDDAYFLYFEDFDLSLRLSEFGALIEHSGVRITHAGGNASRKGWRHIWWFSRSAVRFFQKWGWRWFG